MLTEKDYCDYDTCVALKELGYKVPTSAYYMPNNGTLLFVSNPFRGGYAMDCFYSHNSLREGVITGNYIDAPTMWEAQKWLREVKKILILPEYNSFGWFCGIHYLISSVKMFKYTAKEVNSYEEALLEGVRAAIKLLKEEK